MTGLFAPAKKAGMNDRELLKLTTLSREQLLRKLHQLEDARRVVVALIRSRSRRERAKVVCNAAR